MKIDEEIRTVLEQAVAHGEELRLPTDLDHRLYKRLDALLAAVGGQWKRGRQAHVLPGGAAPALAALLAADQVQTAHEVTVERQFFPTPQHIAELLVELASLSDGQQALEPSAGHGAIAYEMAAAGAVVDCVELHPASADFIRKAGYAREVITGDFLKRPRRPAYDAVVMNPPFAKRQDLRHVLHAEGFVRPGGKLVAIMSEGITFWSDRAAVQFREHVDESGGSIEPLPADTFRAVGAKWHTVVVVLPVIGQPAAPPPHASAGRLWSQMTGADFGRSAKPAQDSLFILDSNADELGTEPLDGFGFGAPLHRSLEKK
ncbi:class I SAM-dependent methyltransferase [Kitasatospora sp. MBT63]|uniref:methyltransferase n=1 Tax=Kitasatospora sp. MBT63 TaxID=1444768 RepID=UPI000689C230|nr:class I SAM-dependent methyltransferase [Kitasatospora sp. MBT63]